MTVISQATSPSPHDVATRQRSNPLGDLTARQLAGDVTHLPVTRQG
jgi:hypothetical protein